MISAYPKIFAIGTDYISKIFEGPVEITEKVDGSQFVFGNVRGNLYMRSKGVELYRDNPEKMFKLGMDYVCDLYDNGLLPEDMIYYTEYLQKPKHNVLSYDRVPEHHIIVFGVSDKSKNFYSATWRKYAQDIGLEYVPTIKDNAIIKSAEELIGLLDTDSVLGGQKIEGVVVKNYSQQFLLGGQPFPIMAGKFVAERFKEKHHKDWKTKHTGPGRWQTFKEQFRTEARWEKAVIHMKEQGELENEPRDIGKLIKEVQNDIVAEAKTEIVEFLWKEFGKDVLRTAIRGLPEWYKEKLAGRLFE